MTGHSLQRFYEDPATPLSSGLERAQMQATMLAGIAASSLRPLVAVDVGCGDGMATALATVRCEQTPGADVTIIGFDWSCAALDRARRRGVSVARAAVDGFGLPLARGSVDVVIMSELIEHLVDTDAALAEAGRVLVPGGRLLLSTPNLAAWYNRVLLAFGIQPLFTEVSLRGIYGRPGSDVVGHLRIFTRRALEEILASTGFVEIDITGAPYHDVPRLFRPLDRVLCRTPALSSILLASARRAT
ncbi:MAG: class I SAM-dependent methyltransferase [Acidimicrobiales bacterium]|jgi:SAM-dependent methyltransferase